MLFHHFNIIFERLISGKNREIFANATRFLELCLSLLPNTSNILKSSKTTDLQTNEKQKNEKEKDVKSIHISSSDNSDFEEGKSFYCWVPPHMKELKFTEMKNYGAYLKHKEDSFNLSSEKLFLNPEKSNFLNTPQKQKDYSRIKKSKSQININKQNIKSSNSLHPKLILKNNEKLEEIIELKQEIKSVRHYNHQYLKKNQDLETKFYEISKAYISLMNCFKKLAIFSKTIILENFPASSHKKWLSSIEKFDSEKKEIENYLKGKSILSHRFCDLVDSSFKQNTDKNQKIGSIALFKNK